MHCITVLEQGMLCRKIGSDLGGNQTASSKQHLVGDLPRPGARLARNMPRPMARLASKTPRPVARLASSLPTLNRNGLKQCGAVGGPIVAI